MDETPVNGMSEYRYQRMIDNWEFATYGTSFDDYIVLTTNIKQIAKEIKVGEKALGETIGLNRLEVICLASILSRSKCDTIPRLAEHLREDKGAVWRTVQSLKEKELIKMDSWDLYEKSIKEKSDENKRKIPAPTVKRYKVKLVLSDKGKDLATKISKIISYNGRKLWKDFDASEKMCFFRVLGSIYSVEWCKNNRYKQAAAKKEVHSARKYGEGPLLSMLKMKMDCQRQKGYSFCEDCHEKDDCDVFEYFSEAGEIY